MMSTVGQTPPPQKRSSRLDEMAWNRISTPGCYLLVASGDLIRVPQDGVEAGHSPTIKVTSSGETRVARLADNPSEPISVLRQIAADNDYFVNF